MTAEIDIWLSALQRTLADPSLYIFSACVVVAFTALVTIGLRRPLSKRDLEVRQCYEETRHRPDRRPKHALHRNVFQRIPGLWSEQECRCGEKTRLQYLGGPESRRAVAFKNSGGQLYPRS